MMRRFRPTRPTVALVAATVAAALTAAVAPVCGAAQTPDRVAAGGAGGADGAGVLTGRVLDAATGAPVAGAAVVLQPEEAGVFPGPATRSAFATASRTATTDAAGRYRFAHLPPGVFRLYVTAYSYRSYALVVELRGDEGSTVSVGLSAEPIALTPIRGTASRAGPYRTVSAGATRSSDRLRSTHLRRHRFLTTDVRELTDVDVLEGVTLGEPDLLRALQRLPGVSTRSEYTAELWTRGAPWYQTRVYYDGVPVLNPLHALGVLSGISSSAVDAVWLHPGTRPAAMGGGAAGVVDLRSRRATGQGQVGVLADASLMSAGLSLDQRVLGGRLGWMLTGRVAYLDWLSQLTDRATSRGTSGFPYGFGEVSGRVDTRLTPRNRVTASWLWEGDHLASDPAADTTLRARWGNVVGRATWSTRLAGLNVRHTVAFSDHFGRARTRIGPSTLDGGLRLDLSESRVHYMAFTGRVDPDAVDVAGPAWSVGYGVQWYGADYLGPIPLPVPRPVANRSAGPEQTPPVYWRNDLPFANLWGEKSWRASGPLTLRTGLRLEASSRFDDGPIHVAPRVSLRFAPDDAVAWSAGYARVYQYTHALAPAGVQLASLSSTDAWVIAGPHVPSLRSDIGTAGVEAWIGPGRLAAINVFGRRTGGVATLDPRPGAVLDRTDVVTGRTTAYGIEASVRQLVGPVTGSVAYTLTRARMAAAGETFPATADRTHVLSATLLARPVGALRLGAAFTAATGVPYTPVVETPETCALHAGCDPERLPWALSPNSLRAPTFASLDLMADWTLHWPGLDVGVYAQLRNALGRENATIYTGGDACLPTGCTGAALRNLYERGLPRLPVVGIRVRH